MRRSVVLAFVLCAGLFAQKQTKIFPYEYDQYDMANGLRVVTVPTDYPNVVSLYVIVNAGARNEVEPGKTGFAHFFEHMMFRGTKKVSPEQFDAARREAGAASNAYTSDDRTVYHITFAKEDLERFLELEADRFQNLDYPEAAFRTEALAVLGEYNKNSASPIMKLFEVLRGTAFDKHTYKHIPMGFLKDIQDMPNQFEYSKQFFDRFYRPEYTTILVVGDVRPENVRKLVTKYWGGWERGKYKAEIPVEPPQKGVRTEHIEWPSPTLPMVALAQRAPAYSDQRKDYAALELLGALAFGETSELYKRLVIEQQKVDSLSGGMSAHVDPYLFTVLARIKSDKDVQMVRDEIISTMASFKDTLVSAERLENVKSHLRYSFALSLDNSEAIASGLAPHLSLARTPETLNRLYDTFAAVTSEDIRNAARQYFNEDGRTIVTLTGAAR